MADEPIERPEGDPEQSEPSANAGEDERYRGATPPGYDWPTHGGYLGCMLGVIVSVLLAPLGYILFGFLGAFLAPSLRGFGVALAVIVTVAAYLAIFIGLSRLGWALGKRFLREYEQPARPVWGEDDEEEYPQPEQPELNVAPTDAEASVEDEEQQASQAQ